MVVAPAPLVGHLIVLPSSWTGTSRLLARLKHTVLLCLAGNSKMPRMFRARVLPPRALALLAITRWTSTRRLRVLAVCQLSVRTEVASKPRLWCTTSPLEFEPGRDEIRPRRRCIVRSCSGSLLPLHYENFLIFVAPRYIHTFTFDQFKALRINPRRATRMSKSPAGKEASEFYGRIYLFRCWKWGSRASGS